LTHLSRQQTEQRMEILSVTLKNFKSHSDRQFIFQPGTNAICGENGAGKTSILEAIAWTLFNYRGGYNKDDLIRNGAGSAQARVAFISSRDGRTYEVERCTTKGYTLFDPQLNVRLDYKHIEDEIMPWLRQQFGVAPGTDLGQLFANTIGVPQGMFTADFLQASEKRKPIFDAILKVGEYRQANQQMLSLEKHSKAEVEKLEAAIAQYEESLQEWQPLQHRQNLVSQEIAANEASLQQLQTELNELQNEKERLSTQAQAVQTITSRLQQSTVKTAAAQQAQIRILQLVERSQSAVAICLQNKESYQAVLKAEAELEQFDQQGKQQQALGKQRDQQQAAMVAQETQLTKLNLQLESLTQAAAEIEQLQPLIVQQVEIEQQQSVLADQINQLQAIKLEQQSLSRQITKLQAEQTSLAQEIIRIQALQTDIDEINVLEQKRDRLQEQLSRVEAAKQFEAELRQLVSDGESRGDRHQLQAEDAIDALKKILQASPLAAAQLALETIEAGIELNTELINSLWKILADLSEQTSVPKLQQQLQHLKTKLDTAYQSRAEFSSLAAKQAQYASLQVEINQFNDRLTILAQQLATEPELQQKRSHLSASLAQLADPRGRSQLLARDLQQQPRLINQQLAIVEQRNQIQILITQFDEQLDKFINLESQIEQQKQNRQEHQPAYLIYLQYQNDANQLRKLEPELQTATAQLQELQAEQNEIQTESDRLLKDYDPALWQQVETAYSHRRSQADQLSGGLPQQRKRLMEISTQIATLQGITEKRDRAATELQKTEKVKRFISFARKVYKEAGPRITERYVQNISHEADRLFRELMNRPNVALEWTKDYEIIVQEGAHNRRFINLSGGEQMCAALAVRLALLRVLADIDIAFFDEPTTNMDRPRRESLAEAIANIKTFRQLFVISHDDTFEKFTENVILVMREV
jgi:DNA repair protein SbcC/Rad50